MNSFGRLLRIMIAGESHGPGITVVIDGIPAGIPLSIDDLSADLSRRQPGDNGTTPRVERSLPQFLSGVYNAFTTGTPLTIYCENSDVRSSDYQRFSDIPRPGHADLTARQKFNGYNDPRGGGHCSGRITVGIVAAGAIAKKIIPKIRINAELIVAGGSPDSETAVAKAVDQNDSCGGIISCSVRNVPAGLGEPFFDSCESLISHAVFSIPGIKGIEFGSGFALAAMPGSEANDPIIDERGTTSTNHAGGINGGITNGNTIEFTVAVKPTASIGITQTTFNSTEHRMDELQCTGRHDACFALRVPVIVEAVTALVMADLVLIRNAYLTGQVPK